MPQSRRGQLLIASARMLDPNFARSVVLIVRDDEEDGAFGLVLNRPLEGITVAEACGQAVEAASNVSDAPLHQGGPCQGPLTVLHASEQAGGEEVVPGVLFSAERDQIEWLMWHDAKPIKYLAGYAGWAPKQLDGEIESGAWLLTPASAEYVFDGTENLWNKLTAWLTLEKAVSLDRIPDDPSVN